MKKEKAAKRAKAVRPRGRTSKPDAPAGVAKISVSVPFDELEWAKEKAGREGSTVSAVIADALRERRQTEAWNEFMTWALDGRPLSPEEIAAAETELWG
ncbi:MAG TPA: hypothetical protein VIM81_19080 [Gammaproteobacteria bacterium]